MRVAIACASRDVWTGNRATAARWLRLFRTLGHAVDVVDPRESPPPADVVVALHARHAAPGVEAAAAGGIPVILALTGTDLYGDIHTDASARRSLELARRIVVLHDLAVADVPPEFRARTVAIRQSARGMRAPRVRHEFRVAVVGHLREVKDPLRAAIAARRLPASSRVRIVAAGVPLDDALAQAARDEQRANPRYRWLGGMRPSQALRLIASAQLLALTSRSEGGANVLGEAVMCATPVVASDIPAARAALGADYPALFPPGDDAALATLIARAETDRTWHRELARRVRARRRLFGRRVELAAWRQILDETG
jgi:putative glycosyltransferase (TIGR04348 family)